MRPVYAPAQGRHQRGVTLIELLVSLGLGLLVVLIAASALLLGRQGYDAVDNITQLRDRERFAADLVSRVILQAGYQDLANNTIATRAISKLLGVDPEPDIFGWNNAFYKQPADLVLSEITGIANGNRPSKCTANDTSCKNGSDILVVRFQGVSTTLGGVTSDRTMINCSGGLEFAPQGASLNDRAINIFHVGRRSDGEPTLYCSHFNQTTGEWSSSFPMIDGVEALQLLYGTDGVTAGIAPNAAAVQDTVAERWLRADQLSVPGNVAATRENWRRVRAVRVGLVLRGPVGSAAVAAAATFNPLGERYAGAGDVGSSLTVAADRRLRTALTFTVHLRNDLSLQ